MGPGNPEIASFHLNAALPTNTQSTKLFANVKIIASQRWQFFGT